jgi:hypothetical protein
MVWVIVFAAIAVGGLVLLIAYAVWLSHKAGDLFSEIAMLMQRVEELADLLARIELPAEAGRSQGLHSLSDENGPQRDDEEMELARQRAT